MFNPGSPGQWTAYPEPAETANRGTNTGPDPHDPPESAEENQSWWNSHRNKLQSHLTPTNLKVAGATVAVGAGVAYKFGDQTIVLIVVGVFKLFHVDFFLLRLRNDDGSCLTRCLNFLEFIVVTWFAIGFVFVIHFVSTPQGQQQYHNSWDMFWGTFFNRGSSSSCVDYFSYSSNIKYFGNVVAAYPAQLFDNFYHTSFTVSGHRAAFCKTLMQGSSALLADISAFGGKPCTFCIQYDTPFGIANCVAPTVFK